MSRYKIIVQYDGTGFRGWQLQKNERTIQGELESALNRINNHKEIRVHGAGRTDTGVHATGQVAHFDLHTDMKVLSIKDALNGNLPRDIKVMEVFEVNENFHARFSATKRHYKYRLRTDGFFLDRNFTWHTEPLELKILNKSAITLLGENDFTSFCKATAEVENKICTIYKAEWEDMGEKYIFRIRANRFLQHMVRYIVGTMLEVARGRYEVRDFKDLMDGIQTEAVVVRAPAQGLFLKKVYYD